MPNNKKPVVDSTNKIFNTGENLPQVLKDSSNELQKIYEEQKRKKETIILFSFFGTTVSLLTAISAVFILKLKPSAFGGVLLAVGLLGFRFSGRKLVRTVDEYVAASKLLESNLPPDSLLSQLHGTDLATLYSLLLKTNLPPNSLLPLLYAKDPATLYSLLLKTNLPPNSLLPLLYAKDPATLYSLLLKTNLPPNSLLPLLHAADSATLHSLKQSKTTTKSNQPEHNPTRPLFFEKILSADQNKEKTSKQFKLNK